MSDKFQERVEFYKTMIREVGKQFDEPDDDWAPMFFMEVKTGRVVVPLEFENDFDKDMVTQVIIPALGLKHKPWFAAIVGSMWMVATPQEPQDKTPEKWEDLGMPRPSQHPDRQECVMLLAASKDETSQWFAKILRDGEQAPALGPWQDMNEGVATLSGTFIEAIKTAVWRQ